jgi:hypothetical protein
MAPQACRISHISPFLLLLMQSVVPATHTIGTLHGKKSEKSNKNRNKHSIFDGLGMVRLPVVGGDDEAA